MRRSLVLTSENARHPFRASLPPHVTAGSRVARGNAWHLTAGDMRGAASVYVATFAAVLVFIL
ncbi:hypothetical protein [Qipengyuania nanhaisediminis]|uniref:hypothetical protein n=1 Tax=Qipengyuania nanhaisediminis TaxID=604088 RepID=UPI0038B30CE7